MDANGDALWYDDDSDNVVAIVLNEGEECEEGEREHDDDDDDDDGETWPPRWESAAGARCAHI